MNAKIQAGLILIFGVTIGAAPFLFSTTPTYDAYVGALVVPSQDTENALVFKTKKECEAINAKVKELAKSEQGQAVKGEILLANCTGVKLVNIK